MQFFFGYPYRMEKQLSGDAHSWLIAMSWVTDDERALLARHIRACWKTGKALDVQDKLWLQTVARERTIRGNLASEILEVLG